MRVRPKARSGRDIVFVHHPQRAKVYGSEDRDGDRKKKCDGCRANDCDNSLPLEGNTESELRNSLLVADQGRASAILIKVYRKQCDQ
jgi:hypothetical protein